jgi:hypothetical protein
MAAAESEPGPAPPAEEASITATEKPREETALDPIVQCIIVRKVSTQKPCRYDPDKSEVTAQL